MDLTESEQRLEAQERLLHAILAPTDQEGSGFDDLVETRSDLTVAVPDVTDAVRFLRWDASARPRLDMVPPSGGA